MPVSEESLVQRTLILTVTLSKLNNVIIDIQKSGPFRHENPVSLMNKQR